METAALVLNKILKEKNLDAWGRVKTAHFGAAYYSLLLFINKHYSKYNELPDFEQLKLSTRDPRLLNSIHTLEALEVPEVDLDFAIDTLINQFAQDEVLKMLDQYVDKVPSYDKEEIKEKLSEIVLRLDEKTGESTNVYNVSELQMFLPKDEAERQKFPLGLNNTWDNDYGGAFRGDLILIGGKKGSGKSLVCCNIAANQYTQGAVVAYFTIEMRAKEIFDRIMCILAGVDHKRLRKQESDHEEILKLAKTKADMYVDGLDVYKQFEDHQDIFRFERELSGRLLKPNNQIVLVHDRELSMVTLDLQIQKMKSKFGDSLQAVVVDYVNQITMPGNKESMYDWKVQIEISKQLKNLANKYDIAMISPYQIDDDNKTRMAKGILDSPDIAILLDAHSKEDQAISFNTAKMRNSNELTLTSGVNWSTLAIDSTDVPKPSKEKKTDEEAEGAESGKTRKRESKKTGENPVDAPW